MKMQVVGHLDCSLPMLTRDTSAKPITINIMLTYWESIKQNKLCSVFSVTRLNLS